MTDTITLKRQVVQEWHDRIKASSNFNDRESLKMYDLRQEIVAALAAPEPLVRYCPDCGSIGPVPATARDCCPDGGHARMVPENFAKSCRETFLRAIGEPQPVKQQGAKP